MSGKPYPAGVQEVVSLLQKQQNLINEISELKPKVQRDQDARQELVDTNRAIERHLNEMDLESPGNYGFGGRMGWFLAEMNRLLGNVYKSTQQAVAPLDPVRQTCQDCGFSVVSTDLIFKSDHHGGTKHVCKDREACHRRSPG